MEFGLDEQQRHLDKTLQDFLGDRLPLERLRGIAESDAGIDNALWHDLIRLGIFGVLVPEDYGGSGLGLLDAAVTAERIGYAAVPTPFVSAAVMAPLAIRLFGDTAQQDGWLPRIAGGEVRVGIAFCGNIGTNEKGTLSVGNAVSGEVRGAIDAAGATHFLLIPAEGPPVVVAADAPGVEVAQFRNIDRTRPLADLVLRDAEGEVLAGAADPAEARLRVLDAGRVALAADILGACQSMFDKALPYVLEREQFGRKIGSFQAMKHQFAEMVTMLEPCRSLVWYAAHAQDTVPEERRALACHAKAHLSEVGREVSRTAIEVHGGMGFTDLMGLHYWYKRIAFDRQVLGSPEQCRRDAAVAQGWAEAVR